MSDILEFLSNVPELVQAFLQILGLFIATAGVKHLFTGVGFFGRPAHRGWGGFLVLVGVGLWVGCFVLCAWGAVANRAMLGKQAFWLGAILVAVSAVVAVFVNKMWPRVQEKTFPPNVAVAVVGVFFLMGGIGTMVNATLI